LKTHSQFAKSCADGISQPEETVCGIAASKWMQLDYDALLGAIFLDPEFSDKFLKFLQQKQAAENYEFFCRCMEYNLLEEFEERKRVARVIVSVFVADTADTQINLEESMKLQILKRYSQGDKTLFENAVIHVQGMLKQHLTEFRFLR